jgi:uncharacterized protein (TIGR02246 family)
VVSIRQTQSIVLFSAPWGLASVPWLPDLAAALYVQAEVLCQYLRVRRVRNELPEATPSPNIHSCFVLDIERSVRDHDASKQDEQSLGQGMMRIMRPAEVPLAFQSAWNAHDMAAFAALFYENATFVNRSATFSRGVHEIVALHRGIHETIYRDSQLENELIEIDLIDDGAAIVHFWSRLTTGSAHPAGPRQVDTLILAVVTRRHGIWRIQAADDVTLTNPRTGVPTLRS